MHNTDRFVNRFDPLFAREGLVNVKFFVTGNGVSLPDFLDEAAAIQDTIAAGEFEVVPNIDTGTPQKRFDAAF